MSAHPHAVILGAGVIGLTNAVFLSEAGYRVTVIAAHVPGDSSIEYTSPWAGAHWRTHATTDTPEQCDWDVQTFQYWLNILEGEDRNPNLPKSGLKLQQSIHLWDTEISEDLWWAPHVLGFKQLSLHHEPILSINRNRPGYAPEIVWGATSKACSVHVPQYLLYLQERARKHGSIVFQSRLPTDGGLGKALATAEGIVRVIGRPKVDCFVNCTGLGAAKLCGDAAMFPIRGQTILVKGEANATRTRYHGGAIGTGSSSYCIPRPGSGTTILGGTKEKGSWIEEADPKTTKTILERCSWMAPELLTSEDGGFEVISAQAGLRPGREGGPRTERQVVGGRKVVHAYGHAGGGYQNSIGAARKVLKLVAESVGKSSHGGVSSKL
ncbi:hypothetical protein DOTSEDRAFT_52578 [Dothistroma septosporum NZE10]|uniref:FAD dependent oxidoreductase domain-containing protein n=1 Tax=Dothistroma septosporum (strain NZE10 / CBS 128990) TaxID=675120 RepID=N1PSB5_DOTSN|nr:hypothetical protein DOTSEDRAFT_52578 [Dothistroma septosporum NZE10]